MSRIRGVDVLACLALVAGGGSLKVAAQPWNQPIPEPATESTAQTIQLADQLNAVDAKFFGAHWCPACKKQMKLFGKQAGRRLMPRFNLSPHGHDQDLRDWRVFSRSTPSNTGVVSILKARTESLLTAIASTNIHPTGGARFTVGGPHLVIDG